MKFNSSIILPVAMLTSLLMFSFTIELFFLQDDFFLLQISKASSLLDLVSFLRPRDDIVGYRPVSIQIYFFLLNSLFNLNSQAFHTLNIILLMATASLVFRVLKIITSNQVLALTTASFWVLSSVHFVTQTWISASYQLIGTFFYLLSFYFLLKFNELNKINFLFFATISFLLALGSFETAITLPILFFTYLLIFKKENLRKNLLALALFLAVDLIYIVFRLTNTQIPNIPEYSITLNSDSIKALIWYFLWSLNVPEDFKNQVIKNLIILNPKFIEEFKLIFFQGVLLVLLPILLALYAIINKFREKKLYELKTPLFFLLWFFITISSLTLLPYHTSTMYLCLASIGILALFSDLILKFNNKYIVVLSIFFWSITTFINISFYKQTSWMISSQRISKRIVDDFIRYSPILENSATIYYPLIFKREYQAISYGNAVQVFLPQKNLKTYFFKNDIDEARKNNSLDLPIYYIVPDEQKYTF